MGNRQDLSRRDFIRKSMMAGSASNWEIAALYILDYHLEDFVCRMAILSLTTKLI